MERRLAAILAADVVGYSRLIRADEEGTLAALKALRRDLIDPRIAEHHGRVVKLMGDGMLAEFASVVDAVRAGVETQRAVAERNADLSEDKRIKFRVGINLGDVVIDGDDIQGDGVNVAARLEGLAEPGGLAVSDDVYRQVRDRLDLAWQDMGERELKNIDRPVKVWSWFADTPEGARRPAVPERSLRLPDKPSIAVLPFDNLSGDPEQEYFADGIAEDIITALSKFRWFFVTARNSTFTYKGKFPTVRQVSKELGVRYVLEGSVRKAANRVRVTGQLVDATTGNQIWADRFDSDLDDIFELQDELTAAIAAAVEPELAGAELDRSLQNPAANVGAWDLYLRGTWHLGHNDRESLAEAGRKFQQAIERDPGFGRAYASLAIVHAQSVIAGWTEAPEEALANAEQAAQKALEIDQKDAFAHTVLGIVHFTRGATDDAIAATQEAIDLNPNLTSAHYAHGHALVFANRGAEAIPFFDHAIRLSPHDPRRWLFETFKGIALWSIGHIEAAIAWYGKACRHQNTGFWPHMFLAGGFAALDKMTEARTAMAAAIQLRPEISVSAITRMLLGMDTDLLSNQLDILRKAGLPEK